MKDQVHIQHLPVRLHEAKEKWNPMGSWTITGKTIKLHLQQTTFHSSSVLNTWLCSTARGKGTAFRVVETPVSAVPRVSLKQRFQIMHQQPPEVISYSLIFKQIPLTLYELGDNCKLPMGRNRKFPNYTLIQASTNPQINICTLLPLFPQLKTQSVSRCHLSYVNVGK